MSNGSSQMDTLRACNSVGNMINQMKVSKMRRQSVFQQPDKLKIAENFNKKFKETELSESNNESPT